jgi:hypothetical protein
VSLTALSYDMRSLPMIDAHLQPQIDYYSVRRPATGNLLVGHELSSAFPAYSSLPDMYDYNGAYPTLAFSAAADGGGGGAYYRATLPVSSSFSLPFEPDVMSAVHDNTNTNANSFDVDALDSTFTCLRAASPTPFITAAAAAALPTVSSVPVLRKVSHAKLHLA